VKILVTGGAGYIGSHFVKVASSAGHDPVVFDNLSEGHRWAVGPAPLYEADLADRAAVSDVLKRENIEAVVHFAANAYVGESVRNPSKYFNNNYVNTLHLLDAMVEQGVRYFILSSTCAVYGVPEKVPIIEDAPSRPINPYGLAKHYVEETLAWYRRAYGLRYASLRYFNAAGADPGLATGEVHDPETHLIPLVLLAALGKRRHAEVFGSDYDTPDGTCVRDYVHVMDLADAHLLALEYLLAGSESGVFNLGNGRGHSVLEVIEASRKVTGINIPVARSGRREGDPPVLVADSSRARETLRWRPRYEELRTIIGHAWDWAREADRKGYL